jgi:ribosome maturation factor RimP
LKKREDFERFTGIEAVVKTFAPVNNQRNFHGRIEAVEGESLILLDRTSGVVKIPLADLASAKLDPEIILEPKRTT